MDRTQLPGPADVTSPARNVTQDAHPAAVLAISVALVILVLAAQ
jgi:hypothetical protein